MPTDRNFAHTNLLNQFGGPMLQRLLVFIYALCLTTGLAVAQTAELLDESGDWQAYKYRDPATGGLVCFVMSAPQKMEGNYQLRGAVWLQITQRQNETNADNRVNVVSFAAGFQFWDNFQPTLTIGDEQFRMHTDNETAWSFPVDDTALTRALRDGAEVIIETKSWRGTEIRDTFSLRGITAMHNRISSECGVNPL